MVRWASCPPCGRLSERPWSMRGLEAHATKNPPQPWSCRCRSLLAAAKADAAPVADAGPPNRAWRSQSSLKTKRHAGDRNPTGEMGGTAPVVPAEHERSRTGGRAVHGIVPIAFEFRWAQYRVGLPREWLPGEVRDSHQAGRRDARRWPNQREDVERTMPPQGGEPERRRDQRRTRRQAGEPENPVPRSGSVRVRHRARWP
jgi:hypothetical protein